MIGIIGKKIGMTQYFLEDGERIAVTLINAGPCPILQVKTPSKDGYAALQIGFGQKRESLINKPLKGHLKKSGVSSVRIIKEVRADNIEQYKEGAVLEVDVFQPGEYVDVTGISIGKGFQGGVKRWHWRGGKGGHGSMHHRQPGSIGASSFPSRVEKGHHLAGRMGGEQETIEHLEVVKIDKEKNLLAVKGSIPGSDNSFVVIRQSKKFKAKREKKQPVPEKAKAGKEARAPKKEAPKKK